MSIPTPTDPVGAIPLRRGPTLGWPVWAWGLWDWGSAAFNAVITTFVFSVYITSDAFGPNADTWLGWAIGAAGLFVALIAPVIGQRADRSGRRTYWLGVNTFIVILLSASLFWVQPDENYLILGLVLLSVGNIFFELAAVNYNSMINDVSTPATVGRVSGLGWGLGYVGGIVLLLIVYFGLIKPEVGLFGITGEDGMDVRVTMLICAAWTLVFSLPVLFALRDEPRRREDQPDRAGFVESYRLLFASIAELWRSDRNTVKFLLASAFFRDGLAGVFAFGGVLAAGTFGFSAGDVIIFAVAANMVAGVATIAFGFLDDRIGPKRVIVLALSAMLVFGLCVFAFHDRGRIAFWIFGLLLCVFVGPAQSASRTFLARLIPPGREGQVFGLYATTGRAVSFLSPLLWSVAITAGAAITNASAADDAQHFGILGIMAVLAVGLVMLLGVRSNHRASDVA